MTKKCFLILLILLLPVSGYTQVTLHVTDADTYMPLQGVVVTIDTLGWLTGVDGKVVVYPVGDKSAAQVSLLGYKAEKIIIGQQDIALKLKRKYQTMADVEIRAKALRIDSIVRTVAERIPQNYLRADMAVPAQLNMQLMRGNDTLLDVYQNLYLHSNKKNTWLEGELYKLKESDFVFREKSATYDEVRNYMIHILMVPERSFAEGFFNIADNMYGFHTVVSTFIAGGDKYFDIVFLNKKESKVKYSLFARVLGYGGKNNPNADRKYVGVFELIINTRNMALTHSQSITLATSDEAIEQLLQLNNRDGIRDWLDKAYAQNRKYVTSRYSFVPATHHSDKWQPYSSYYRDNLQHVAYRGDSIGDYTFIQEFLFDAPILSKPENTSPAGILSSLLYECRPPEEQQKKTK